MIVLEGQPALSHFRRARLESRLQSIASGVRIRGAWHVYFIEPEAGATPDLATLRRILQAGDQNETLADGDAVIVLGGPAMLIGLGGGAASSVASGESAEELDFASVQRDNPEMERRCQEVIDRCVAMGADNPILWFHDVGAGGLSNAIPELLHDSGVGGVIDLAKVPSDDP